MLMRMIPFVFVDFFLLMTKRKRDKVRARKGRRGVWWACRLADEGMAKKRLVSGSGERGGVWDGGGDAESLQVTHTL